MSGERDGLPEVFVCYECSTTIYRDFDESKQHSETCPTRTNYWTVQEFDGVVCDLCEELIPHFGLHRFIPQRPVEGHIYEVGEQRQDAPMIVCLMCSVLVVVPGGNDHNNIINHKGSVAP